SATPTARRCAPAPRRSAASGGGFQPTPSVVLISVVRSVGVVRVVGGAELARAGLAGQARVPGTAGRRRAEAQGVVQLALALGHSGLHVQGEVLEAVAALHGLVGGADGERVGGEGAQLALDLGGGPDTGCGA